MNHTPKHWPDHGSICCKPWGNFLQPGRCSWLKAFILPPFFLRPICQRFDGFLSMVWHRRPIVLMCEEVFIRSEGVLKCTLSLIQFQHSKSSYVSSSHIGFSGLQLKFSCQIVHSIFNWIILQRTQDGYWSWKLPGDRQQILFSPFLLGLGLLNLFSRASFLPVSEVFLLQHIWFKCYHVVQIPINALFMWFGCVKPG